MQWVVTTGTTVEEAKKRALDALGIDEDELEFEILDEPKTALFGLRRVEARVRARVRPTRPRPKVERRQRRKPSDRRKSRTDQGRVPAGRLGDEIDDDDVDDATIAPTRTAATPPARASNRRRGRGSGRQPAPAPAPTEQDRASSPAPETPPPIRSSQAATAAPTAGAEASEPTSVDTDVPTTAPEPPHPGPTGEDMSDITLEDQQPTAVGFVEGLLAAFGAPADIEVSTGEDGAIEIEVTGADLGLLVGPRGATLAAIQELTRTAVAQQHSGRLEGRLRVDIAGYRARRKEALQRFAVDQANRVVETGRAIALEPMSPPDRKTVHDAVGDIAGVKTSSRGEDNRRHVVIEPA